MIFNLTFSNRANSWLQKEDVELNQNRLPMSQSGTSPIKRF